MIPAALRLSLCFDSPRLKADLDSIQPQEWTPHYNDREYGGRWSGVALRSLSGSVRHLVSHTADRSGYVDTPLLNRCAYLSEVLAAFPCRLRSVRLLSLGPRSSVREHTDPELGSEDTEIRIHVPIRTNSSVEFYIEGSRLHLEEGRCYYIDAGRPHRVVNRGTEDRVHLVIDAEVNDWLFDCLCKGQNVQRLPAPPTGFDAFRKVVFADVELQRTLSAVSERGAFRDAAVRAGRERGFDFDELDMPRLEPPVSQTEGGEFCPRPAWLPVSVRFRDSKPYGRWVHFSRRLTEPFFDTSLRNALRIPFARAFQREEPIGPTETVRAPSGFVFHMSRCGSTLIGQMLAALDRSLVISEAPAIDDVIQANVRAPAVSEDEQVEWLRTIVSALGQPPADQDLYVVKLDSWHIHKLPLIRRAFPATPWVFLYRDPVEVLVSQLRNPGKFSFPGAMEPSILDMRFEDITGLSRAEWCARALAGFCRSALRFRGEPGGLFLNYDQLPEAVWTTFPKHFAISFTGSEVARMREAACFDAKSPAVQFQSDSRRKQREAEPAIRELAERFLRPLYLQLENERLRMQAR